MKNNRGQIAKSAGQSYYYNCLKRKKYKYKLILPFIIRKPTNKNGGIDTNLMKIGQLASKSKSIFTRLTKKSPPGGHTLKWR